MKWLIAALVWCAFACPARGDTESARLHYKKGLSAYALGRFKDAAAEYEAAFDLEPDPALLYNAAQAHRIAGEKERALLLYENYLRLFPHRPNEKEVRHHIVALRSAIESDSRAKSSPPIDPMTPDGSTGNAGNNVTIRPEPEPVLVGPPLVKPEPTTLEVTSAPPKKKSRAWVWGVVGGVAGVVVVGVAVGLAVGLSGGTAYPHGGIGTVKFQ